MNDHPDLEALSAYSDGEAPEWADHVASCPTCRARLEEFAAVTAAVRQPPGSLAPASIDAAIGRAMAEAGDSAPRPTATDEVASRRARTARALTWTAVASVAALVVAVVGTLAVLRNGDDGGTTTADQALTEPAPPPTGEVPSNALSSESFDGAVVGGELGPVDANDALVARVEPALRESGVLRGEVGSGTANGGSPEAAGSRVAPSTGPRAVGSRPCELQARERDPGVDDVVYVATATWEEKPVVVLGFTRRQPAPPAPPAVTLMVLARDGCGLVSATPL